MSATVGVVGLGEMGGAFVERLLAAGKTVSGWNRSPGKAAPLVQRGMRWAASPADVVQHGGIRQ